MIVNKIFSYLHFRYSLITSYRNLYSCQIIFKHLHPIFANYSTSISYAIQREQNYLSGISDLRTYNVVVGSLNNIYYLETSYVNSDSTSAWIASFSGIPSVKGFALDSDETYVYFLSNSSTLSVFKLSTTDGSIISVKNISTLTASSYDIKIFLLSDSSGFTFITNRSSSSNTNLCRYLFSSISTLQCYEMSFMKTYASNQLKISDSKYFIIGIDSSSYNLKLLTLNYGDTTPVWADEISCPSGSCSIVAGDSYLDSTNNKIYSFFTYGSGTTYLQFTTLDSTNGDVIGSRFISSIECTNVWSKIGFANNILGVGINCSGYKLFLYSTETYEFTIRSFSGNYAFCLDKETLYGRLIMVGQKSSMGYITKFTPESFVLHPDFSSSTIIMNIQSSGNYDIISITGLTISSVSSDTVIETVSLYSNLSITIMNSAANSYTSQVLYQTAPQSFLALSENNYIELTPNLPCSQSSSPAISFSLSSYNGGSVPSWVNIDSSSGLLKITTPSINLNSQIYEFSIASTISGETNTIKQVIKIQINKCGLSNCQKCNSLNYLLCSTCSSGYTLTSGSCAQQASTQSNSPTSSTSPTPSTSSESSPSTSNTPISSNAMTTAIKAAVGVAAMCACISSIVSSSSPSSLWTLVNSIQSLFVIMLVGTYLPVEVVNIIVGSKFALVLFDQIPIKKLPISQDILHYFDYDQDNSLLASAGVESGSSIVNLYSFFCSLCMIAIIHFTIKLFLIAHSKYCSNRRCCTIYRLTILVTNRFMIILTFSYYIRAYLGMHQYILLSIISEINRFNLSSVETIVSIAFSMALVILCASIIVIVFLIIIKLNQIDLGSHKLREFFSKTKSTKCSRFYIVFSMIKRSLFALVVLSASSFIKLLSMIIIQSGYLIYLVYQRPFDSIKDNIAEVISETFYCFFTCFLFRFHSKEEWTSTSIELSHSTLSSLI